MLLTENFSTETPRWQHPFQASHISRSVPTFCSLEESPEWRFQAPSTGGRAARPGCAGEMGHLLIPSAHPGRSEQGHVQGGCSGAMELLYHSAVFHDCCLPTDKSSWLCPCAQRKAFQIACTVHFISIAGLLVSLPTRSEQPHSRNLIRQRARSGACQRP